MQSVKKVASIALSVVMWIIILVAALYAFTTLATREDGSVSDIAGFTPLAVQSDSMAPTFNKGDLIIIQKCDTSKLEVGDIVTFHTIIDNEYALNTHRIAAIDEVNGMRSFTTKGDNNDVADTHIISDGDIVGKYVFALPQMGKVMDFLSSSMGFLIVIVLPMLLFFIYQVYHLIVVGMNLKRAMAEEDRLAAAAAIVDAEGKGDTATVTADNAAEQLAQAEAKLEEARRLKAEAEAAMNATKQEVLDHMDEKNKLLALKVNAMGGTKQSPYVGASALADDHLPTVGNVVGAGAAAGEGAAATAVMSGNASLALDGEGVKDAAAAMAKATVEAKTLAEEKEIAQANRFPKLSLVDLKYRDWESPAYDDAISLEDFVDSFRAFACSQMKLYYTPEVIRRFVAGMAASKLLILEGISGTGKTSLPYSFSRYLDNPATIVSVQPSFRDRTEVLGYFNEFSKRFNETEFLRAVYEAGLRQDPSMIVLDEMNLARVEYYFAEILSVLEMPSHDEWVLDLVPTQWAADPKGLHDGKLTIPDSLWFIGTANNDDSTFTITDKVYDRAIPIELNERADAFECEPHERVHVTADHLQYLFQKAKVEYVIDDELLQKMHKLDQYLQTRFKLAFGNRIIKQMYDFIPVYVACGGTELGGMDYIIARKVLKKFESMNVSFVRDEMKGLIEYIEKTFGEGGLPDSVMYLQRIQNFY